MASNMACTPPAQDDELVTGCRLTSRSCVYTVQSFLGQGTFGKVTKCTRMDDMRTVAVKMIKNQGSHAMLANLEVATLMKLRSLHLDKSVTVEWNHVFIDRGHICLEFEHLDKSLYDFMEERYFQPLLLREIRPIVQQLANALDHLKAAEIIHADLKLENVMLVNHLQEPYRVKVIDFGLACNTSAARTGSYIQSRAYRAPEIILGIPFTEAIDMWSLGCLAASMYLGALLYPGSNQYDMMRYIIETQGQPPDHLLTYGYNTSCFFQRDYNSTTSRWKLKTPDQFHRETGIEPKETRRFKFTSLDQLLHVRVINPDNAADKIAEIHDALMFVAMVKEMLQLDAAQRITPRQVLEHDFISMRHIANIYSFSHYVRSCYDIMGVCQSKAPTSDSESAACSSLQQPPSMTTYTVQQNPPTPAEGSSLDQPHCINPHPCTSTQTTGSDRSGMKRKVDEEDGNKTSSVSKRVKPIYDCQHRVKRKMAHGEDSDIDHDNRPERERKRARKCDAGTSTRSVRRNNPADDHHHSPSSCTQTESQTRSGLKRKAADDEDLRPRKRTSDP
ncbi:homeodomain-interacting protein kinase 3-like protein, partial [Lates japonicus]